MPLSLFIVSIGIVLAVSIASHAYFVYRFRDLWRKFPGFDKELPVISIQIAELKCRLEENTFTNRALEKVLISLFGKPTNGG